MKGIKRGNRVSPGWFFLGGLLLLTAGMVLLAEVVTAGQGPLGAGVEDTLTIRVVAGVLCIGLGVLSLQIWLIAFAITVGLVETNRRLERLEHLPSMDWYAEQSHASHNVPPGLRNPPSGG